MVKYLTSNELEQDMLQNPKEYIGKMMLDRNGLILKIISITKDGIQAEPIQSTVVGE
jgi:hypothetical protein